MLYIHNSVHPKYGGKNYFRFSLCVGSIDIQNVLVSKKLNSAPQMAKYLYRYFLLIKLNS